MFKTVNCAKIRIGGGKYFSMLFRDSIAICFVIQQMSNKKTPNFCTQLYTVKIPNTLKKSMIVQNSGDLQGIKLQKFFTFEILHMYP